MNKNYLTFKGAPLSALILILVLISSVIKSQVVQTFSYTGTMQSFTVPPICPATVTLEVWGAQGGANWASNDNFGGYARAVFNVSAGDVLNVFVGEQPNGVYGGYNGGGAGEGLGRGGGGGSDIRLGGNTLLDRIIVAGGGGGAGSWSGVHVVGGQGGGLVGLDGYRVPADPGGQGGTQMGSGLGTCVNISNLSMAGGLGYGGTPNGCGCDGYGGGGGYYGGAGSGNCRGGGGGSGFILSTATYTNFLSGIKDGHGKARISYLASGSAINASIANPLGVCPGGSTTLNVSGVVSNTWTNGSNASSLPVSPLVTTIYSVSGTNVNGCVSNDEVTVFVNPLPTLSLSTTNPFVCEGQSATLTAQGAFTYFWTSANGVIGSGNAVTVFPMINAATYIATGISAAGCVNTQTISMSVDLQELMVTSNTMVCIGKPVFLSASGANSYTWTNNMNGVVLPFQNVVVSPTVSSVYSVSGIDANNCVLTETLNVIVNQNPNVIASASKTYVCKGDPITISATGANTYSWNTNATEQTFSVTPALDAQYVYIVKGTDSNSCSATATVVVKAELCTSEEEMQVSENKINIFPNPNGGLFHIEIATCLLNKSIKIYNISGALIKKMDVVSEKMDVDLQKEPAGIYFVHLLQVDKNISVFKVIKE